MQAANETCVVSSEPCEDTEPAGLSPPHRDNRMRPLEVGDRVAMDNPGKHGEDDRVRAKRPPRLGTIIAIHTVANPEPHYAVRWDDGEDDSYNWLRHALRKIPKPAAPTPETTE